MPDDNENALLDCPTCHHRFEVGIKESHQTATYCPKCKHFVVPAERQVNRYTGQLLSVPKGDALTRFACPACGKRHAMRGEHAGKVAKCGGCGALLVVPTSGQATPTIAGPPPMPAPPPANTLACPRCSRPVAIAADLLGQLVACPHCAGQFQMPGGSAPPVQISAPLPPSWQPAARRSHRFRALNPSTKICGAVLLLFCLCAMAWLVGSGGSASNEPAGRNEQSKKSKKSKASPGPGPTRADKALVDRWLKENLDDPNYEVVRWYGPEYIYVPTAAEIAEKEEFVRKSNELSRKIAQAQDRLDGREKYQNLLNAQQKQLDEFNAKRNEATRKALAEARANNSEPRVIGLKFRCIQRLVGKIIRRTVFKINDGKAVPVNYDLPTEDYAFSRWFPDEE